MLLSLLGCFSWGWGVVTFFFTPTQPSYIRARLTEGGKGMNAFVFMSWWQKVHCLRECV